MKFNWHLNSRKGRLGLTVMILFGLLSYVLLSSQAEKAYNPENLIRFHVIAQNNSPEEQSLKLRVRDRILEEFSPLFQQAQNPEEARSYIKKNIPDMKRIAVEEVRNTGKDHSVEVKWGDYWFPTKSYGNFVLPAGNYEAVNIVIGEGEGKNWWCVLFPPLCFVDISNSIALDTEGGVDEETLKVMKEQYYQQDSQTMSPQIRLKILDILSNSGQYIAQKFK